MSRAVAEVIGSGPTLISSRVSATFTASPYPSKGPPMRRGPVTRFEIATGSGFSLLELVLVSAIIAVAAAIAIPRYGAAGSRHKADLAARRVAADLRQAQLYARTTSASCTVAFTPATSTYQLMNVPALDGVGGTYTVNLKTPPYEARIISASFDGVAQVIFSGWGLPSKAGTVVIAVGSEQRTIAVDSQTGRVSVQ